MSGLHKFLTYLLTYLEGKTTLNLAIYPTLFPTQSQWHLCRPDNVT